MLIFVFVMLFRHLDLSGETLAWMMVIDGSFLLEFLRNYSDAEGKAFRKVPSMSHMVDAARMKLAYNSILRDIVMLENQIPLNLVRKILRFQSTSNQIADSELSTMLIGFVKEVCYDYTVAGLDAVTSTRGSKLLRVMYVSGAMCRRPDEGKQLVGEDHPMYGYVVMRVGVCHSASPKLVKLRQSGFGCLLTTFIG